MNINMPQNATATDLLAQLMAQCPGTPLDMGAGKRACVSRVLIEALIKHEVGFLPDVLRCYLDADITNRSGLSDSDLEDATIAAEKMVEHATDLRDDLLAIIKGDDE